MIVPIIRNTLAAILLVACSRSPSPTAAEGPGRCLHADAASKYDAVFVASPAQAQAVFVGWRLPGPRHTKVGRNPFTNKEIQFPTTEPPAGSVGSAAGPWELRPRDVAPDAGYAGYLESRVPPEVRALPHLALKEAFLELMDLARAVTGSDDLPTALYPPSGCSTAQPLLRVPDAVTKTLRAMDETSRAKLVARITGEDALGDWSPEDVAAVLDRLRALLQSASGEDGLYFLPV